MATDCKVRDPESLNDRLWYCFNMLYFRGVITYGEHEKYAERLAKWLEKNGEAVPLTEQPAAEGERDG